MGCCCSCTRTLVSKKKKRYIEKPSSSNEPTHPVPAGGVDLDMIIFNGNIVCMGFPASGLEAWYRNPYSQVLEFLDIRFSNRYKVYNLCVEKQHQYDMAGYFHGRTATYPFRDHHACPLALIPDFIEDAVAWVGNPNVEGREGFETVNPPNSGVVAIHCKAGKGRTGLMAICLLMALDPAYSGNPDEAIAYYGRERAHDGKGLTHRSQIRYVQYYAKLRALSDGKMPALIPVIEITGIRLDGLAPELSAITHITVERIVPVETATRDFAAAINAAGGRPAATGGNNSACNDKYGTPALYNIYTDGSIDSAAKDEATDNISVTKSTDGPFTFDFSGALGTIADMLKYTCILFCALIFSLKAQPLVPVQFYGMSKCPYAAMMVGYFDQNTMLPGIAGITNITFDYIAQIDPNSPSGFDSKHGPSEVQGDLYEVCVEYLYPSAFWAFLVCADNNYNSIPDNLNSCASTLNINPAKISACVKGLSSALLTTSIKKTDALGITNSPTVFIAGQCVYGSLTSCTNMDPQSDMMLQAICAAYTGKKPASCSQLDGTITHNQNQRIKRAIPNGRFEKNAMHREEILLRGRLASNEDRTETK